jgi:hypothetical protein
LFSLALLLKHFKLKYMSKWSEKMIMERELDAQFDRGYSYAIHERKLTESRMWQEYEEWAQWAENNRFALADGTLLDGKINP